MKLAAPVASDVCEFCCFSLYQRFPFLQLTGHMEDMLSAAFAKFEAWQNKRLNRRWRRHNAVDVRTARTLWRHRHDVITWWRLPYPHRQSLRERFRSTWLKLALNCWGQDLSGTSTLETFKFVRKKSIFVHNFRFFRRPHFPNPDSQRHNDRFRKTEFVAPFESRFELHILDYIDIQFPHLLLTNHYIGKKSEAANSWNLWKISLSIISRQCVWLFGLRSNYLPHFNAQPQTTEPCIRRYATCLRSPYLMTL